MFESIRQAAALSRKGKDVERGVVIVQMELPLEYEGPRDPIAMWDGGTGPFVDIRDAAPAGKRITVARPIFHSWSIVADVTLDTEVIDPSAFEEHVTKAGKLIGIGTYRKLFGRYDVDVLPTDGKAAA